jgi:hypothetical protein
MTHQSDDVSPKNRLRKELEDQIEIALENLDSYERHVSIAHLADNIERVIKEHLEEISK